jgi:hypothetical protein
VSATNGTDNHPMILCSVWVPGSPKTKGSLTVVNSGAPAMPGRKSRKAYVEDTPESKRWRMLVVERIRAWQTHQLITSPNLREMLINPYPGPVYVSAMFYQAIKPEDWVRKVAGSGDLDKLMRNVFDALSVDKDDPRYGAGVIIDDMQVVDERSGKRPMAWGPTGGAGLSLEVTKIPT